MVESFECFFYLVFPGYDRSILLGKKQQEPGQVPVGPVQEHKKKNGLDNSKKGQEKECKEPVVQNQQVCQNG